ncbi:MAG: ribonucleotide-diphosphate reductase subunit alpha, partial [Thalassotalea sp.]|nr:ribonucleotide-diphosphate reductase subunit alpha [Thalassotalea sp.]
LDDLAELAVRALDSLLDYQDYPVPAALTATMGRRTLGIGVINYAYYLAKNGVFYSNGSANNLTHRTFEAIQYYLLKASNNLAKEQGACPKFNETRLSQGILPIDTYKKEVDKICSESLHLDWEGLRASIKEHGVRNSTVSALMPSETSSQISNATNGIEPPRGLISIKASKDGILKQVVPEYERLKNNYELLWNIPDNTGYLELVGIMQKFVDQTISANTNYDPSKFVNGKVPIKQILKDILLAYKLGVKTMYYHNTRDGSGDDQAEIEDDCVGGACKI